MSFVYTPEELRLELHRLLFGTSDEDVQVRHLDDAAGYQVSIGPFRMCISYDQLRKPDPALSNGWTQVITSCGETWKKGQLRVAKPRVPLPKAGSYVWHFGKCSDDNDDVYPIAGRCADRDVAMAAAEALK